MTAMFKRKQVREEDLVTDVNGEKSEPWQDGKVDHGNDNADTKPEDKILPRTLMTEIYQFGRREYDDRLEDVVSQKKSWRSMAFVNAGGMMLAIAGCIYLGSMTKVEVVTLERDKNLDVVAVRTAGGKPWNDPAYISADIKRWIKQTRTVYTDSKALTDNINSAYKMIAGGSPAFEVVSQFFNKDDPFERAKKFTVEAIPDYALPNGDGLPDSEGRVTWRAEWVEHINDRNGILIRTELWTASFTFLQVDPESSAQVTANPSGILFTNIAWNRKDIAR